MLDPIDSGPTQQCRCIASTSESQVAMQIPSICSMSGFESNRAAPFQQQISFFVHPVRRVDFDAHRLNIDESTVQLRGVYKAYSRLSVYAIG